jgi:hypothetical protein
MTQRSSGAGGPDIPGRPAQPGPGGTATAVAIQDPAQLPAGGAGP